MFAKDNNGKHFFFIKVLALFGEGACTFWCFPYILMYLVFTLDVCISYIFRLNKSINQN